MTSVRFYRDRRGLLRGFSVIGHAGSAPSGEDLVCAGVSVLSQTAVNALEAVAGIEVVLHMGDGFLSVRLPKGLSAKRLYGAQVILRTVRQGLEDMAKAYPRYVRVT
ncbi:MAG: ribosomal-processing cysteine protease Prp [Christensenellales bacterium]|uniref:Ribosomal processing cysteine protease Prp n=1 Tax=Candidatus Avichristensenella intestinipullorum TaxID=2840693 RepID=A0A9D1CHQ1_9FIRM|nr:ribosomal-processing cysteine protease Prp [Christensenellales bacterium]HIQ61970.1 ribosomal-processing cysteine protease Prp [Candidatus Avichristensenella intestinipullorum]